MVLYFFWVGSDHFFVIRKKKDLNLTNTVWYSKLPVSNVCKQTPWVEILKCTNTIFLSFFLSVCENKYYSWSCFTFGIQQTLWKFIQKKNGEAVKQKTCLICGKNKHLNSLLWKVGKINSLFHISVIRSSRDGCFDIILVHISQFRFASKVNNNDNLQTKPEVASRFSI